MKLIETIRARFAQALTDWVDDPETVAGRVAVARDPRFGDYQANIAMPLEKKLGMKPMAIAQQLVERLSIDDLCLPPEILPPGFINLRLRPEMLAKYVHAAITDERLGVDASSAARTFVIDYSAPNVAKPMHVGHIRSTVIGDALSRILRFLGHRVISDNHLGDWGTQFGMVIYGYKHFVDRAGFAAAPVEELSRLYRLVQQIIAYQEAVQKRPAALQSVEQAQGRLRLTEARAAGNKKAEKEIKAAARSVAAAKHLVRELDKKIARVEADEALKALAQQHPQLETSAQLETVKLHTGDEENLELWHRFLPLCIEEIEKVYRRLSITFDHQYGESFYHPMLEPLVDRLKASGLAQESDGALCIFLPTFDAPMIVRKADGAFLYATTDLATIEYRMEQEGLFSEPLPVGARGRPVFVQPDDKACVDVWKEQGFNEAMKTPDSTLIFVSPEKAQEIHTDQVDCMGCLSHCRFSNWKDHDNYTTGKKADPRSFCIQKTLQEIILGYPIDTQLMFSGHNAYKFKNDPFYANGFVPTVKQLVDRILTGY